MAKMTKVEMLGAIKNVVADNAEMVVFLDHEIELLGRRNAKGSRGLTKTQKENQEIKARIVDFLGDGEAHTATEVAQGVQISQNKATALLTQLKNDETVIRIVDKKVARFTLAGE